MCGRFPQSQRARDSVQALGVKVGLAPRPETWNLAPSTKSMVVRNQGEGRSAGWLT